MSATDIKELFKVCKVGDLQKLKELIEQKEIDINLRDKWDSTPLFYASLCGHLNVVRYLLKNGARCEANTFDGERCVYGALTNEIRKILRDHKVVTSRMITRGYYDEFLRKLYESGEYFDILFSVHGEVIKAHKCILAARSAYFAEAFEGKWKSRKMINLNNPRVKINAFKSILQYIYTGRLDAELDEAEDVQLLAKRCNLIHLFDQIEDAVKKIGQWGSQKPGTHVTKITIEHYTQASDFSLLLEQALPKCYRHWIIDDELPLQEESLLAKPLFPDISFKVGKELFKCHKVFFCGRSEYFKAMVNDHFLEHEETHDLPIYSLREITVNAFIGLLSYVYTDEAELTLDNVYETLMLSDLYLLPGLKSQAASFLGSKLNLENLIDSIKIARLFGLARLEAQCTEFMAKRLEQVVEMEEFKELITSDAKQVVERQETDTIDVIDDIRYYITSHVQTFSETEEANAKLRLIDDLLDDLGLEG